MRKLIGFVLFSLLLLTGCSLNGDNAQQPWAEDAAAASVETTEEPVVVPEGVVEVGSTTFESTSASITTKEINIDVAEVQYHIWRTADGQESLQKFSAQDKDTDFTFQLDIEAFSGERGEYQVAAYGINDEGEAALLGEAAVTFQQYVPILMYHAIDEYKDNGLKELFVTPDNFKEQMEYLRDNGYTMLTFERFDEINKVNKPVLVTMDDGMKNNMNALHILQELQDDEFQPAATVFVIADTIDKSSSKLSSGEIKEMVDSGIFSIQSHTMSHTELPQVTDYEKELKDAKEKIEQVTGQPVVAISYPVGRYNDTVVEEAKKYYQYAVTTQPGQFIKKGETNEMLLMNRVRINYSTTLEQFAALVK